MSYFRIVTIIFSLLTLASITGVTIFLYNQGFYPAVKEWNNTLEIWVDADSDLYPAKFNYLTLFGMIMLSVYIIPVILRPLDFMYNLLSYISGFLSYFLLLPIFLNVMQVYSMSNLHDISWGNRPTNAH